MDASGFELEIRSLEQAHIVDGVVIEAFPSMGISATIAGLYIVGALKLHEIAAISSAHFPPISVVSANKPEFPARIYGREGVRVMVCISEFAMPAGLHMQLAKSILSWSQTQKCSLVISSSGTPLSKSSRNGEVRGVGSNEQTRQKLKNAGISLFESGVVSGLSAALLNEGRLNNVDVVALVLDVDPEVIDTRAASGILKAIGKLLPDDHIDGTLPDQDAQRIENRLKALRQEQTEQDPDSHSSTYG